MSTIPVDPNGVSGMGNFDLAVAMGAIDHWESYRQYGANPDVDVGTEEVWQNGGIRTLPSSAGVATVVSSSANDAAAGTGIRTVRVVGLDANYDVLEETVTLNGITGVATVGSFLRIRDMHGLTGGTGATAAGTISCTVGGNVQVAINAGLGQSLIASDTVPDGKVLLIREIRVAAGRAANGADIYMEVQFRLPGTSVWREALYEAVHQASVAVPNIEIRLPAQTDYRALCTVLGANNNNVSCAVRGYLIDAANTDVIGTL